MIIKNEERYLEGCLESVKDFVDEIVIVDTGSTDKSLIIAEKYNAKILWFNWINDFSAARNFALKNSKGNYILYLDADERISEESIDEIKKLTAKTNLAGFKCMVESPSEASGGLNVMKYVRLFANHNAIKFTGKVHEQIENSLIENKYSILESGIKIIHLGYNVSEDELKIKAKRNLSLLLNDYEKLPTSYVAFQIGQTYVMLNELYKSEKYFLYAVERKNISKEQTAHCYRYLAAIESNLKNDLDKAIVYLKEGLKISHKQPLLNVIAANVYLRKNDFNNAESFARKAYEFNLELSDSKSSEFEITIKNKDLLNHILNIAMLSCNVYLFNDFYNKSKHEINEKSRTNLLKIYYCVFNNIDVEENLYNEITKIISQEFIPSFLFSLSNYKNINIRTQILEQLKIKYPEEIKILGLLGHSYLELNEKQKSYENYENAFNINQNDPALLFTLISLSAEVDDTAKLIKYLKIAEINFNDNPAVLEKINNIKSKIESVQNF